MILTFYSFISFDILFIFSPDDDVPCDNCRGYPYYSYLEPFIGNLLRLSLCFIDWVWFFLGYPFFFLCFFGVIYFLLANMNAYMGYLLKLTFFCIIFSHLINIWNIFCLILRYLFCQGDISRISYLFRRQKDSAENPFYRPNHTKLLNFCPIR